MRRSRPSEGLCTSHLVEMTDVVEMTGVKQTIVSHLALLRDAGLVVRALRTDHLRRRPEPLRQLSEQLAAHAGAAETDLPPRSCP